MRRMIVTVEETDESAVSVDFTFEPGEEESTLETIVMGQLESMLVRITSGSSNTTEGKDMLYNERRNYMDMGKSICDDFRQAKSRMAKLKSDLEEDPCNNGNAELYWGDKLFEYVDLLDDALAVELPYIVLMLASIGDEFKTLNTFCKSFATNNRTDKILDKMLDDMMGHGTMSSDKLISFIFEKAPADKDKAIACASMACIVVYLMAAAGVVNAGLYICVLRELKHEHDAAIELMGGMEGACNGEVYD